MTYKSLRILFLRDYPSIYILNRNPNSLFYLSPGEHKVEQADLSHPNNNNGPVTSTQNPLDSQNTNDSLAEHGEQDADDEAAEDTDDTRSAG